MSKLILDFVSDRFTISSPFIRFLLLVVGLMVAPTGCTESYIETRNETSSRNYMGGSFIFTKSTPTGRVCGPVKCEGFTPGLPRPKVTYSVTITQYPDVEVTPWRTRNDEKITGFKSEAEALSYVRGTLRNYIYEANRAKEAAQKAKAVSSADHLGAIEDVEAEVDRVEQAISDVESELGKDAATAVEAPDGVESATGEGVDTVAQAPDDVESAAGNDIDAAAPTPDDLIGETDGPDCVVNPFAPECY